MSTRQEDLKLHGLELRDVVVALKDVAGTQWYDLGLQLKLSPSILDTIASDHQAADDCKRMMLRKWLQSDLEASWEKLVAALILIGHETTAAKVRSQFVKIAVQAMAETVTQTEEDEIRKFIYFLSVCKYKSVRGHLQTEFGTLNVIMTLIFDPHPPLLTSHHILYSIKLT